MIVFSATRDALQTADHQANLDSARALTAADLIEN
jgi:hypothetical protein